MFKSKFLSAIVSASPGTLAWAIIYILVAINIPNLLDFNGILYMILATYIIGVAISYTFQKS